MGDMNQDPSMEEILASIKRVISDDSRPAPGPRSRGKSAAAESEPSAPAATRSSLATLATLRQQQPKHFEPQQPGEGPLEAVVREMLRPMLKEWLDTRLPEMVEEMVAREIARITGKSL
jgi:uncharacterized protein